MIIALLLISTAFVWLLRETDYLRVRLPVGKPTVIPATPVMVSEATPAQLPAAKVELILLLDTLHYYPGKFVEYEMPEMSGQVIPCVRTK